MSIAPRIAASGYASVDHPMAVDAIPPVGRTAVVRRRLGAAWPDAGGCPRYVGAAVRQAGCDADVISWVGGDPAGERYLAQLRAAGLDTDGVAVVDGAHSPQSYLFYAPEGTVCFFDPGVGDPHGATAGQRAVAREADWLVVTVGYASATSDLLDHVGSATRLGWVVKADADAFPPRLVQRLLATCRLVGFNAHEHAFLQEATGRADPLALLPSEAVALETHGAEGLTVHHDGHATAIPVEPVDASDTTGAGDTLFGATVAALTGGTDTVTAARAGAAAARRLLAQRVERLKGDR